MKFWALTHTDLFKISFQLFIRKATNAELVDVIRRQRKRAQSE
eukprot:SAG31_NODE_10022_length_1194_cov_1.296804_2_plen_42_part_01